MTVLTPTDVWSVPVVLASAEIWEIREGMVYLSTDTNLPSSAGDGLRLYDGSFIRFEAGESVRHRAGSSPAQIIRMPVL